MMMIISQVQGPGTWSFLSVDDSDRDGWLAGDHTPHTHGSCHGVNTVLCPTQLIVKGTEYKH